jgi:hypothetical protein
MALLQISEPGQSTAPHQHRRAIGIDLGTTHSLVATVRNSIATVLPERRLAVAEMLEVPAATPRTVTLPRVCTVATEVCDDAQVAVFETSRREPSLYTAVAMAFAVAPALMVAGVSVTTIDVSVGVALVMVHVPLAVRPL